MNYVALISLAIDGVSKLIELISNLKEVAKQNHELTADEEIALDKKLEDIMSKTWWKVE